MSDYIPDRWVMIKIASADKVIYKILAGWSGGYLHPDSWKLNSGCTGVTEENDKYIFSGYSGSKYHCRKSAYGLTALTIGVLDHFIKNSKYEITMLPEETDFLSMKFE